MAADDAGLEPRSAEVSPWIPGKDLSGLAPTRRPNPSRPAPVPSADGVDVSSSNPRRAPAREAEARSPAPRVTGLDVEDFLHHLRTRPDPTELVDDLVERGVALEHIYLDLLAPAARRLGELWECDRCDYFQVTLLVGRMQGMVHCLGRDLRCRDGQASGSGRRVLLAAPDGEQHTLGLVIVGEFFLRAGWSVSMGRPLHSEPCVDRVARQSFDLVGLSVSRDDTLEETAETIRAIRRESRNPAIRVILGGRVLNDQSDSMELLGADSWVPDGARALAVAEELCCGPS